MTTSSGSNWSRNVLDCVLIKTLCVIRSHLEQLCDEIEGVGVKAQLGLVNDDQGGEFLLRLEEERDEAHGTTCHPRAGGHRRPDLTPCLAN